MTATQDLHMGPGWYMRRTPNATKLIPFYRDALGTSVIRGAEPVYFLWAGESYIIELKAEKPPREERVIDPTVHPCTPVFHTRDLETTLARLLRGGGELISSDTTPFGREAFLLDPDRQIVGIREPIGGETALGRIPVSDYNPGCAPLPDDLIGLRTIVRRVADMDTMIRFYRDVIGFKEIGPIHGRHLFDQGEGVHLELAPGGSVQTPPQDRVEITNHFIVRVVEHDAFNHALKDAGTSFSNDSFRWNSADMSICIDPEGHIMGFEERFEPHEYGHPRDPFEEDMEADKRWRLSNNALHTRDEKRLERGYAPTRFGALHYTCRRGTPGTTKRPLICLHPSPYSGAYFESFQLAVDAGADDQRDVYAFDHIGFGNSAKTEEPLTAQDHAMAIGDALDSIGFRVTQKGMVDVMGYHSGSVFAGELAVLRHDLVAKLALVTYPYFDTEDRLKKRGERKDAPWLTNDLESLESKWSLIVAKRPDGVPFDRAITNLLDDLKAGETAWHGFDAVFGYPAEDRLPLVKQQTLIINTDSILTEPTEKARSHMNACEYLMLDHMKLGVFDIHAGELANAVSEFLDRPLDPYVAYRK